jgi:ABC-2 type transport system permease protein
LTETVLKTEREPEHETSKYLADFQPRLMDWGAARVFMLKNLKIAIRYPANFLVWGILPLLWFAPFILMATALVGPGGSANFTEISGFDDFIQFSVIGWFIWGYLDNSIWAIGNNFRWEQFGGTLEPLFSTPTPRISIMLGSAFSDSLQGTLQMLILLTVSIIMFGVEYAISAILPVIIILLFMVFALYGFGFMVAGLIMVFKDPGVLTQLIGELTFMVSPITYPLQALPTSVRYISYLIPTTIGVVTIREIAITGVFNLLQFAQAIMSLGLLIVLFWGLGLTTFHFAEKWTKKRGHMGGF